MELWLNGRLVTEGTVSALSAGVTLGWGVFTTVGISEGSPRFLRRHFERLKRDAAQAQVSFDTDYETVKAGVAAVHQANEINNGLARLTLTQRGDERWNAETGSDLSIAAIRNEISTAPLRVKLSSYRLEAQWPLAGVKTTSYLPYLWAWREAKNNGFDEAILINTGVLSEAARSNLFWVRDGKLFTPALSTGCLRGLGRELVLKWGKSRSLRVKQGRFLREEAQGADEVWLVSAAAGPRPVASWHDEAGVLIREFEAGGKLRAELTQWWDELAQRELD